MDINLITGKFLSDFKYEGNQFAEFAGTPVFRDVWEGALIKIGNAYFSGKIDLDKEIDEEYHRDFNTVQSKFSKTYLFLRMQFLLWLSDESNYL